MADELLRWLFDSPQGPGLPSGPNQPNRASLIINHLPVGRLYVRVHLGTPPFSVRNQPIVNALSPFLAYYSLRTDSLPVLKPSTPLGGGDSVSPELVTGRGHDL